MSSQGSPLTPLTPNQESDHSPTSPKTESDGPKLTHDTPTHDTLGIKLQRRVWSHRASSWDHEGSAGLDAVVSAVLDVSSVKPRDLVVDLGCGTGQLSIPLAKQGALVKAVDVSQAMIDRLKIKTSDLGIDSIEGIVLPIEQLNFSPGSIDLVVSNYALHHLRDADKQAAVKASVGWLRPGGHLVIGDMMFSRGSTSRDRTIIKSKVMTLVARGPGGWWRLAKNIVRFMLRVQERPVGMETWVKYFQDAGLIEVEAKPVVAEAAVVVGTKPI